MPIRLRITALFSLLVFLILGLVCAGIYYFSFVGRQQTINNRLYYRAITTARLLNREEFSNQQLVRTVDSLTTLTYTNKSVQAYGADGSGIYRYSDRAGDTIAVNRSLLEEVWDQERLYFHAGDKDVVGCSFQEFGTPLLVFVAARDLEGLQNLERLRRLLWLVFIAGNVLVWVAGYIFSMRLLQPVRNITADVAEISAQNLTRRLPIRNSRDEWGQLATTLNELLNRLQDSFDMQRRFISNASHELSTPLTSISSQLEVSLLRERSAEAYRAVMRSIYQDVQHMGKLTQTLLEFAKASGNTGGLEIEVLRIDEILLGLPAEISKVDPRYVVTLRFEDLPDEEERLLVYGNEALLFTAIKNITLNACKYSSDRKAEVLLQAGEKTIIVQVVDHGIGISEEHMEQIFQPFFRVEENLTGGFGLGLPLARRIIGLHKGEMEVYSQKGSGTRFILKLPAVHARQETPGSGAY